MNYLVSVVIPTFKRPFLLERAIKSVLNQSYKNIEIIVVDDNDPLSDFRRKTELIMKNFNQENVKYLKHSMNYNGSKARNTGAKNSSGSFLMFLDDDDEFLPNKVKLQLENLINNRAVVNYCGYYRFNNSKFKDKSAENRSGNLFLEVLSRNLFISAGSNLMIKKSIFMEHNGFDESFERNQDIEFLARITKIHKLEYVDYYGLIVNLHKRKPIDFILITNVYLDRFSNFIRMLNNSEKEHFYTLINLQIFRFYFFEKRKIFLAFNFIRLNSLKVNLVLKYIFYLINRKFLKLTYGFKFTGVKIK